MDLCDDMTIVACAMSRRPPDGGLAKLRGSMHQDHDVLDTGGWTTRSLWHRSQRGTDSAWHTTADMEEKNTTTFIRVVCPTSTHTDWWVLNCDYPTCSDGKKQQMKLRVRLYITSDDISTYHHPEDILDGQSSAQSAELFSCYDGCRHQPSYRIVSRRTCMNFLKKL